LYPFEFLRTRLAADVGADGKRVYKGMTDLAISIFKSDGATGLFQGYGIALTGGIFYRILFLGGYDALKSEVLLSKRHKLPPGTGKVELSWTERFACAQTISLTAGTLAYPFDSVRRRMMMQAGQPLEKRVYRGSLNCVWTVWSREGLRGFYLGIGPNLLRSVSGALLLVGYDTVKYVLR
jgi:solute carrier family 25 (adenine nucleotide translocator) protein 4/5/6/31